jgi:WD40 repeat protein
VIVWEQRKQATTNTITTTPKTNQYSSKDSSYHNKSRTNPVLQQPQLGFKGLFGAFGGGSPQPPSQSQQQQQQQHQQPLMSSFSTSSPDVQYVYTWHCRTTFKPNSEAIRDVQWSPIFPDGTLDYYSSICSQYCISSIFVDSLFSCDALVFALVTASGALIVYNQYITARVIIRISAHSGDASTIHWHPTQCNVIATGGDRSVKIWNFEREFEREFNSSNSTNRDDVITLNMERNASTSTSRGGESVGTNESSTVAGADTFR